MPLLSFRPRSSGLQVIAQMCPRRHRQGARRAPGAGRPSVGQTTRSAPYGQRSRPGTAFARWPSSSASATRRFTGSHGKCGTRHSPATPRAVFAFLATAGRAYHSPVNLVCWPSTRGRGAVLYTVQVRVDGDNVAAEMSEIWEWLDQNQVDAEVFRYRMTAEDVRLRIEFGALSEASAFAEAFSGSILGVS
jgi:hypothetical protein